MNLAEEIESLGRSQRHAPRRRLALILEHLMKLELSPAIDPRTIGRGRLNIEDLLRDSPSLKNQLASMIEQLKPHVTRLATASLFCYGETVKTLPVPGYSEDQVIGDWFPGETPLPASGEREGPASAGG